MHHVYLIGNAHLDPVWLWRWQDGFAEMLPTFRSALDRMKEFPDYKFTSACASYYEWVERIDPDMFEEIKERVKEDRWGIVGGWYLQPDCNLPCGESFARHALISQRYFKEAFGRIATTGYNADSFGHNAMLPQILQKSGMENYCFMRPGPHENESLPTLFQWESDDGSRVTAYRITDPYCATEAHLSMINDFLDEVTEDDRMFFYGVGNHGGGPTVSLLNAINEIKTERMIYATPDEYFEKQKKDRLPLVHNELQHHARGCYAATSSIKRSNRVQERNLISCEALCTLAKKLVGMPYPKDELNRAWKNLLFHQFHDILGGCSIRAAYQDASYFAGETMAITERLMYTAMQAIANRIDTLCGEKNTAYHSGISPQVYIHDRLGTPYVIFNPNPFPVSDVVKLNCISNKLTDETGTDVPYQTIRADRTNGPDNYDTAFIAEIPALDYRIYRVFPRPLPDGVPELQAGVCKATKFTLENDVLSVHFQYATGEIASITDKRTGKEVLKKACRTILTDETACDTWAHNRKDLGKECGVFRTPVFRVVEEGSVRAAVNITIRHGNSTVERTYTLTAGSDCLNVSCKIWFTEKHKALKFTFPIDDSSVISEIPFGTITRPQDTGEEFHHMWVSANGLCVANNTCYSHDTADGELRMTVLRGSIYADHYGKRDEACEYAEQGENFFTYQLFPYSDAADATRRATLLNNPLRLIYAGFHEGELKTVSCGLTLDNDKVIVTAVKEAEDGTGNVIRLVNTGNTTETVTLSLLGKSLTTTLTPYEIKTVNMSTKKELNFMEW